MFRTFCAALLLLCSPLLAKDDQPKRPATDHGINIVFIGDSITRASRMHDRATQAPPGVCAKELSQLLTGHPPIYVSNDGYNGATTLDFTPANRYLDKGDASVEKHTDGLIQTHPDALLIFSVMLGTNDSANKGPPGAPVSADTYGKNLKSITDALVKKYPDCLIIFNKPIYYTRNTHNGSDYEGDSAHDRLLSYNAAIDKLIQDDSKADRPHLYPGDAAGYAFFESNYKDQMFPEKGQNGIFYLHPTEEGSAKLGQFWAAAIAKVLHN